MSSPPRYPLHQLLTPEFGFGHDVILRVFNGDGEIEGDLKAHGIILALGSVVLKEFLFSNSGVLDTWKVVEARGASLKIAKLMLDFLYMKPDVECGWEEASAEEIFQLASLADQFQIVKLQEKVNLEIIRSAIVVQFKAEAMLSVFPMEKEDILEVASIAVHFETHFPTAAKALLDKCTSLLVSTMHTAKDVAHFADQVQYMLQLLTPQLIRPVFLQASKDGNLAPLVVKLLAGMANCKISQMFEENEDQKFEDVTQADVTRTPKDGCGVKYSKVSTCARGGGLSIVGHMVKDVGLSEKDICLHCKMVKSKCLGGQAVQYVKPGQVKQMTRYSNVFKPSVQVGCRVVTQGPYWKLKNQGMVATVVKAADAGMLTVR